MSDTGAPWLLPYPLPTDLVKDGADNFKDLAEAVADGLDDLDAAIQVSSGLVTVKHVLKTDTFTAAVASAGDAAVTGLSITHALADANNRLIITAFFGAAATSQGDSRVGIAVNDGTNFLAVGDAEGSRRRVTAGGPVSGTTSNILVATPSITFVHSPNTTSSLTYTVHAMNIDNNARTLFINRSERDNNGAFEPRTASALVIQEIRV